MKLKHYFTLLAWICGIILSASAVNASYSILTPFTADILIDFNDLTVGDILEPGDPIAPGVTFSNVYGYDIERAEVVDLGSGDLALQMIMTEHWTPGIGDIPSELVFKFDFTEDVMAAGLDQWCYAYPDGIGNAAVRAFDGDGNSILAWGSFVYPFMGIGMDEGDPSFTYFSFSNSAHSEYFDEQLYRVDDLRISFGTSGPAVPEPATMLLLGSGLIGLAGFRRKFKK